MRLRASFLASAFAALAAPDARAQAYLEPAPSVSSYADKLGFLPPSSASDTLDTLKHPLHRDLEYFLLEGGAWAGAQTGDPVLLAWFAVFDTGDLAPWSYSNCMDQVKGDLDYQCPAFQQKGLWQVGLGSQVTDNIKLLPAAVAAARPGQSAQQVGQRVLTIAAQSLAFPEVDPQVLADDPTGSTAGRLNSYWASVLMRDLNVSAHLEAPPATAWPCYKASYPGWCGGYYRQADNWQWSSDILGMVVASWNTLVNEHKAAKSPDVIVDDLGGGFALDGDAKQVGKGGWGGHFRSAAAGTSVTATWTALLPKSGKWRLLSFVPYSSEATCTAAPLSFQAADGPHSVTYDQNVTGGRFSDLGVFSFNAGPTVVTATAQAPGGSVAFDAIRFHLEEETGGPTGPSCGDLAKQNGWTDAKCEFNGNNACNGQGTPTWDCLFCCGTAPAGQGGGAGSGGSAQAGSGGSGGSEPGGSGGSPQAGSGGSPQAGSGGSPQAGSAGSAQAGSPQAGSGGSAQAGQGGSKAGSGGSLQAGSGGSPQAGSGGSPSGGSGQGAQGGKAGAAGKGGGESVHVASEGASSDDGGCQQGRGGAGGWALLLLGALAGRRRPPRPPLRGGGTRGPLGQGAPTRILPPAGGDGGA